MPFVTSQITIRMKNLQQSIKSNLRLHLQTKETEQKTNIEKDGSFIKGTTTTGFTLRQGVWKKDNEFA